MVMTVQCEVQMRESWKLLNVEVEKESMDDILAKRPGKYSEDDV